MLDADGSTISSGLKPEHLPVFDCAFKAARGERSLSYMAHLRMMAAAQPFLSGAISKTVNLPEAATVEEIMNTYVEGWRLGLKAIAIYRDDSKRSAPLNVRKTKDMGSDHRRATSRWSKSRSYKGESSTWKQELRAARGKPVRHKMPDTRMSLTHRFEIAGHEGYITVGLFEDGMPGELFVTMSKEGSTIGGLMDTVGTLTSIALQYGVPLESLVKKFAYQRFEPSGFTKNPDIRNATSITDYVFRWLGCQFIKGYKEAIAPHRKPAGVADERNSGDRQEGDQSPGVGSRADCRKRGDRRDHEPHGKRRSAAREWPWQHPRREGPRGARQYVHGYHLLALRQRKSHSRRGLRGLHGVRNQLRAAA